MTQSEGFGKRQLFEILDGLEEETRPLMLEARARFVKEKGDAALKPYNMGCAFHTQGIEFPHNIPSS